MSRISEEATSVQAIGTEDGCNGDNFGEVCRLWVQRIHVEAIGTCIEDMYVGHKCISIEDRCWKL